MSRVKGDHREFMTGMTVQHARKRWRRLVKFWLKTEVKRPRQGLVVDWEVTLKWLLNFRYKCVDGIYLL